MKKRLKTIVEFAKPHKWKFVTLLICVLLTTFIDSFFPYIFGLLVDEVFYGKNLVIFYKLVVTYSISFIINQIIHFVLNMSWANLMTKFLYDIRKAIFSKVLSLKGIKLSSIHSGDIVFRMGQDVEQFMNFIHWNIFYLLASVLKLAVIIGIMTFIYWPFAVFAAVLTPIIVYLSRSFSKKIKEIERKNNKLRGLLSSWLFEIIRGMQEVKLFSALKGVLSDYVGYTIKISRLKIKADKLQVISERINSGISLIWQMILYCISAFLVVNGNLSLGGFTACVSYFARCINTFNALNNHLTGISGNLVGIDRVCDVLNIESEYTNGEFTEIKKGEIEFKDVSFSYTNGVNILDGLNFKISPGEQIALVGRSGEGKSTIVNMLLGFYEASKGTIYIDKVPVGDYSLQSLRNQIGTVHQETILFERSIRYNLIFSNDKSFDEEIVNVLKRVSLYDFFDSLPDGLDTVLGEGGQQLSGGQKQRLAVARVILKDPKILIFDEATSALDSESEHIIKDYWDSICQNRTILIITHRLSTIIDSHRILVLNDGIIAGEGSHKELIKTCDVYKSLFKEQSIS